MVRKSELPDADKPRSRSARRGKRPAAAGKGDRAGQEVNRTTWQEAGRSKARMQEERYTLPLRKGGEADVRRALGYVEGLAIMLRHDPEHFNALLAIAEGRPEEASPQSVRFLKRTGHLTQEGTMHPEERAVLLSSFEIVGDGPNLSMPFDLRAEGAQEIIGRAQEQIGESLWNVLRRYTDDRGR